VTKVYRVEHKTAKYEGVLDSGIPLRHWSWLDAPEYYMTRESVCGVTSLKNLHKWFPTKTMKEIHSHPEYHVIILDVPKIDYKDDNQVVFKRNKAKVIGRLLPDGKAQYLGNNKRSQRKSTKHSQKQLHQDSPTTSTPC